MKCLLRIFELSKNEQRVVLIVMLLLITIGFVQYERRVYRRRVQPISAMEPTPSPSPVGSENDQ
jgi:hypothetical protein